MGVITSEKASIFQRQSTGSGDRVALWRVWLLESGLRAAEVFWLLESHRSGLSPAADSKGDRWAAAIIDRELELLR